MPRFVHIELTPLEIALIDTIDALPGLAYAEMIGNVIEIWMIRRARTDGWRARVRNWLATDAWLDGHLAAMQTSGLIGGVWGDAQRAFDEPMIHKFFYYHVTELGHDYHRIATIADRWMRPHLLD
jgi:hypothetical protein